MFRLFPDGPLLPDFRSVLVQGEYHASAPLHLCLSLSSIRKSRNVIFITTHRPAMHNALADLKDTWLSKNANTGEHSRVLSSTHVYYPRTPEHCLVLLSSLRTGLTVHDEDINIKADHAAPPYLIILHELSAFFLSENVAGGGEPHTTPPASAFISIIGHAMSTATSFPTEDPPRVVVFDSRLKNLHLPIHSALTKRDEDDDDDYPSEQHDMGHLIHRYFDLICAVEAITLPTEHENITRRSHVVQPNTDSPPTVWTWKESRTSTGTLFSTVS